MNTKRSLLSVLLLTTWVAATVLGHVQAPDTGAPLSLEDIVQMSKAGVSEDIIITKVKKHAKPFDLSPAELAELKRLGISDTVIKFLLDPSQPYIPAAQPQPGPTKTYPADANASKIPPDPGLYHFVGSTPGKTDIKMLLGQKSGAGFGKLMMKKGKTIAYLLGPASKTRVNDTIPVFYLRLPEGKGIEEVVLVAFERRKDRREMPLEPPPEAMRQFDGLEVGPHLFRITAKNLTEGEYLFLLVGSADSAKGTFGKGWDFGVEKATTGTARS